MKVEFDIQLHTLDMYRYNLYHAYTTASGYLAVVLSMLIFAAAARRWEEAELSQTVLYVALGVVFLLYVPVTLYARSKQQVHSNPVLKNILHYTIDDKGVTTSQGELSSTLAWEQVYRIVATRHNILVCSNPRNAFIIPREQVVQEYDVIRKIAQAHLEKYRFKMKESK